MKTRTIIAGSRVLGYADVCEAMDKCGWEPSLVISGGANGVDLAGERWAVERSIPVQRFPAQWAKFGRQAGYKRNLEMADNADALVAVWTGKSPGTAHMIEIAKARRLHLYIHYGY